MGCGRQGRLCVHPCLRGTLAIAVRVRPRPPQPKHHSSLLRQPPCPLYSRPRSYGGKLLDDRFALEDRYPYSWVRYVKFVNMVK